MNIHKYLQALKQKHLNHSLKKLYDRLRSKGGGTYINIHIQFMELIKQMIHIFHDTSKPCFVIPCFGFFIWIKIIYGLKIGSEGIFKLSNAKV